MRTGDMATLRRGEEARGLWWGEGGHRGDEKKCIWFVGVRVVFSSLPRFGRRIGEVAWARFAGTDHAECCPIPTINNRISQDCDD